MTDKLDLVLERTIDAPVDLVWKAYTDAEHLKRWFAPRPYEITECDLDLKPGGVFRIRMMGPDGFDTGHGTPGCVLEVVEGKKLAWTSALGPGYRPNESGEGCDSFPNNGGHHLPGPRQWQDRLQGRFAAQKRGRSRGAREDGLSRRMGHRGRPARGICAGSEGQRLK